MKLAFIGDLTVDIYPRLNEYRLGGASLISAIWAKRLGAKVTVLAAVGDDEAGKRYREFFQKNHLPLNFLRFPIARRSPAQRGEGGTSRIEIFLDKKGEREFGNWQPGAYAKYHLGKKEYDFLKTQDAVVLPVYFKTRHLLSGVIKFRSLTPDLPDCPRPLIISDFDDLSQFNKSTQIIEDHLKYIDIVKVGLDQDKDKALMEKLRFLVAPDRSDRPRPLILVTLGKQGSLAFSCGKICHQKAIKTKVADTTGAGDAFLAGFLVEYLRLQNIPKSLKQGAETAAKAISQLGAF